MSAAKREDGGLRSLPRRSLRDSAVIEIRNAITVGRLKPGQNLVETQLSEQLGISRGTLREAMRQLYQEGLLVQDSRNRTYVPELSPRLIRETFRVRNALEIEAAIVISQMPDKNAILHDLAGKLNDLAESAVESLSETVSADLALHREICRACGNTVLLNHWESLAAIVRMSILHAGPNQARANMAAQRHHSLLDVIANGSVQEIWAVFDAHMNAALDAILASDALQAAVAAEHEDDG